MSLHLKVLTPDLTLFEGMVESVQVPGQAGPFEVLKDYAPIVASLQNPGQVRFRTAEGQTIAYQVMGGVVEVLQNKIVLLSPGISSTASVP